MATLGIPFVDVLRILVAILLLGNIEFVDGEGLELDVKGNNGKYQSDSMKANSVLQKNDLTKSNYCVLSRLLFTV